MSIELKTVDELVEFFRKILPNEKGVSPHVHNSSDISTVKYVVSYCSGDLIHILKSEHNKPSIFDLMIIQSVVKEMEFSRLNETYEVILELYKNRKV